jgi:hypothetical protein
MESNRKTNIAQTYPALDGDILDERSNTLQSMFLNFALIHNTLSSQGQYVVYLFLDYQNASTLRKMKGP